MTYVLSKKVLGSHASDRPIRRCSVLAHGYLRCTHTFSVWRGGNAFLQVQGEILKQIGDDSSLMAYLGNLLLAENPSWFKGYGKFIRKATSSLENEEPRLVSNLGVTAILELTQWGFSSTKRPDWRVLLNCGDEVDHDERLVLRAYSRSSFSNKHLYPFTDEERIERISQNWPLELALRTG